MESSRPIYAKISFHYWRGKQACPYSNINVSNANPNLRNWFSEPHPATAFTARNASPAKWNSYFPVSMEFPARATDPPGLCPPAALPAVLRVAPAVKRHNDSGIGAGDFTKTDLGNREPRQSGFHQISVGPKPAIFADRDSRRAKHDGSLLI